MRRLLFPTKDHMSTEELNPNTDVINMDVPLFIRLMEFAREDAKTDMELHKVAENITNICNNNKVATMDDYDNIIK